MTDNKRNGFVHTVEAAMKTFTEERKDTFSRNLVDQLKLLSGNLDSKQQKELRQLQIQHVVDEVSQAVVSNVVIQVKAWAELVTVCAPDV